MTPRPLLKKILIVDDDKEMLVLMGAILKEHYDVIFAGDGLKAIERSNENLFDLILMDIRMPFFSGFWFCDAFKHRSKTRDVPVIMISSLSDESNIRKAFEMGATGYLKKPFQPEELLEAVKKVLV